MNEVVGGTVRLLGRSVGPVCRLQVAKKRLAAGRSLLAILGAVSKYRGSTQ
jgi:hypothetical protein